MKHVAELILNHLIQAAPLSMDGLVWSDCCGKSVFTLIFSYVTFAHLLCDLQGTKGTPGPKGDDGEPGDSGRDVSGPHFFFFHFIYGVFNSLWIPFPPYWQLSLKWCESDYLNDKNKYFLLASFITYDANNSFFGIQLAVWPSAFYSYLAYFIFSLFPESTRLVSTQPFGSLATATLFVLHLCTIGAEGFERAQLCICRRQGQQEMSAGHEAAAFLPACIYVWIVCVCAAYMSQRFNPSFNPGVFATYPRFHMWHVNTSTCFFFHFHICPLDLQCCISLHWSRFKGSPCKSPLHVNISLVFSFTVFFFLFVCEKGDSHSTSKHIFKASVMILGSTGEVVLAPEWTVSTCPLSFGTLNNACSSQFEQ